MPSTGTGPIVCGLDEESVEFQRSACAGRERLDTRGRWRTGDEVERETDPLNSPVTGKKTPGYRYRYSIVPVPLLDGSRRSRPGAVPDYCFTVDGRRLLYDEKRISFCPSRYWPTVAVASSRGGAPEHRASLVRTEYMYVAAAAALDARTAAWYRRTGTAAPVGAPTAVDILASFLSRGQGTKRGEKESKRHHSSTPQLNPSTYPLIPTGIPHRVR